MPSKTMANPGIGDKIMRWRNTAGVLFLYFSLLCLLLVVGTWVVCFCYVFLGDNPFRNEADYCWCEDSISLFISEHKKMPTSWAELKENAKQHFLYDPIQGIETRVEMNFDLFANLSEWQNEKLNVDNVETIWFFRFYNKPDTINPQKMLNNYLNLLRKVKLYEQQCPCPRVLKRT
ncbi:MAG: hypothetical protein LBU65_01730 [Planctomycetaceae bacterium]|jgi:hypothetical protein|nr:hypothetical protein [Planctomycetaceae bacterium]